MAILECAAGSSRRWRRSGAQARAKKVWVQAHEKTSPVKVRLICGQLHACTQDNLRAHGCGEILGLPFCSILETRRVRRPAFGFHLPPPWGAASILRASRRPAAE